MTERLPYNVAVKMRPAGACYCDLDDEACYNARHWSAMDKPDAVIVQYSLLPNFACVEVQHPPDVVATNALIVRRMDLTEKESALREAKFVWWKVEQGAL